MKTQERLAKAIKPLIHFTLQCEPDDCDYRGNCSAIDEETDRETEEWIRKELDSGNEWAWCMVTVSGSLHGIEESDYLCGCSYRSRDDFMRDGSYEDMRNVVADRIAVHLLAIHGDVSNLLSKNEGYEAR